MIARCNMRDAETRFSIDLFCCRGFFLGVPDRQCSMSYSLERAYTETRGLRIYYFCSRDRSKIAKSLTRPVGANIVSFSQNESGFAQEKK